MSGLIALVAAKGAAVGGAFVLIFWLLSIVVWVVCIYFCYKIGKKKGYDTWIGLVLGIFLSWIGLIIMAVLPTKAPATMGGGMSSMPMAPTSVGPMAPPPAPPAAAPTPPPPSGPTPPAPPPPQA